jgi:hypothetical protein
MILVDPDDLAAHPTRDLAQLAFLIGRGLIDRTDAEIDNRSAHSSTLPIWQRKDAMRCTDNQSIFDTANSASKMARYLGFSVSRFRRGFSVRPGAARLGVNAGTNQRMARCRNNRPPTQTPVLGRFDAGARTPNAPFGCRGACRVASGAARHFRFIAC